MKILLAFIAVVAVMSLIAFFTYLSDKRKAIRGEWRIRESVLISLGLFGGALGALLAMNLFHHKIKKWYFWAYNILFLLLHITAGVVIFCLQL